MTGRRWRAGGSVFSAVVLLAGGVLTAAAATARSADTTTRFPAARTVVVDNRNGPITVRAGGPGITVHRRLAWTLAEPWLQENRDDTTLTLHATCGRPDHTVQIIIDCEIAYDLEVPPETALDLSATGPISVTGVRGDLRVRPGR
ncbi:hypothetical protein Aph02nite_33900 [Actinoplanes philippinensis]|uniref:Auto-transporter adhesin head GIN domain-containing protein n=1 Tax=Actinoplanes philippinensis TaxID=35752 RepID=A0A1I2DVT8_9ACTN|nr:hypothetical protein [Actinoplanes philippinensis]GIE77440.1 hypothetical protein Aph02nite_33900 [Actinoplanes philippinensis]SFE84715.1 hypothetical protein SAMN05421541_10413 [Actinoplanes philippinensis]